MANHNEVAHAWANQTGKCRKGFNMFYDGNTIYSYGRHFPIARLVDGGVVLMTSKSYSTSTAKHKTFTWRAIHSRTIFCVPNVMASTKSEHDENRSDLIARAVTSINLAKRARKYGPMHLRQAEGLVKSANDYAWSFDLDCVAVTLENLDASIADIAKRAREQEAAEEAARIKRAREQELANRERLTQWLRGADVHAPRTKRPYFRVKNDEVQTSWGANVPFLDALLVWQVMDMMRKGEPVNLNGVIGCKVGDFTLNAIDQFSARIGCHVISYRLARIAACAAGLIAA